MHFHHLLLLYDLYCRLFTCPSGSTEEHLTTDQGVAGSNPVSDVFARTLFSRTFTIKNAHSVGIEPTTTRLRAVRSTV